MKTKHLSSLAAGTLLLSAFSVQADPLTDYTLIFDGDGDASFTTGTETTASPEISDAHRTSPAANFGAVTLADGDSLSLSGTVSFDVALNSNQFRWGLFDSGGSLADGDGFFGYFAESSTAGDSGAVSSTSSAEDNGAVHPFATSVSTDVGGGSSMSDPGVSPGANTALDFLLTLTRNGANIDLFASLTDNGSYTTSQTLTGLAAVPGDYTYDSAAFLMGGAFSEPMTATFSDIDVTYSAVPEPSAAALLAGCFGLTWVMLRRRRRA